MDFYRGTGAFFHFFKLRPLTLKLFFFQGRKTLVKLVINSVQIVFDIDKQTGDGGFVKSCKDLSFGYFLAGFHFELFYLDACGNGNVYSFGCFQIAARINCIADTPLCHSGALYDGCRRLLRPDAVDAQGNCKYSGAKCKAYGDGDYAIFLLFKL